MLINLFACKQNLQEKVNPSVIETKQMKPSPEKNIESSLQIAENEFGVNVARPIFWPGFYGNTYKMYDEEGVIKHILAYGDNGDIVHAVQFEYNNNQQLTLIKETFQGEAKNISMSLVGDDFYESNNFRINMKDGMISKLIQFSSDLKTDFDFAYSSIKPNLHLVVQQEVDSQVSLYKSAFNEDLISSEYLDDMVNDFDEFLLIKKY